MMRLEYTDAQMGFRREIREWLAGHVPKQPLQSFDTERGFAQYRHSRGRSLRHQWPENLEHARRLGRLVVRPVSLRSAVAATPWPDLRAGAAECFRHHGEANSPAQWVAGIWRNFL